MDRDQMKHLEKTGLCYTCTEQLWKWADISYMVTIVFMCLLHC